MVRRHGWQLPTHTFQVVAITVFFLLAVAFYVFFAPFLGSSALEYAAIALYSPVVLAVFLLYVRCSAIDPSDSGIFVNSSSITLQEKHSLGLDFIGASVGRMPQSSTTAWSSPVMQSEKELDCKVVDTEDRRDGLEPDQERTSCLSFFTLGCLFCGWVLKDDNCLGNEDQQPSTDEDVLYCTLCNAEVQKYSKHCRSCDKCVDRFDHHCRWLNNCVGKKNYASFVLLMASSLLLLILNFGVGIAVLVRCFVDKKGTERHMIDKLGNGFTRVPFATVVAMCTVVSLLASIPLGELFFFHIILIKKGITTYEYVVAMRAQGDPQGTLEGGEQQSIPSSPTSSTATGLSGSSSLGLQYRGAWCTPPRVFVEHQDEVMPHLGPGMVPSTIDPDASIMGGPRPEGRPLKKAVRISAWRLAKLDPSEATRAAAKARGNSSILRPLGGVRDLDGGGSSDIASSRTSISTEHGFMAGPIRRGEAIGIGMQSRSSYSSPSNGSIYNPASSMSPLVNARFVNNLMKGKGGGSLPFSYGNSSTRPLVSGHPPTYLATTPASDGYDASSNESIDNNNTKSELKFADGELKSERGREKAVFWDRGAGKFISLPTSFVNPFKKHTLQEATSVGFASAENLPPVSLEQDPNNPPQPAPLENLVCKEASIFFGGPLSVPIIDVRNDNSLPAPPAPPAPPAGLPPKHNKPINTQKQITKELKRQPRGSMVRSPSPVFVPHSVLAIPSMNRLVSLPEPSP